MCLYLSILCPFQSLTIDYFVDDEADRKKKKKTKAAVDQVGLSIKSKFSSENADGIKKNNAVSKRVMQPEGSFLVMDRIAKDQKEVRNYFEHSFQSIINPFLLIVKPDLMISYILEVLIMYSTILYFSYREIACLLEIIILGNLRPRKIMRLNYLAKR